jgi:tetratricopeptide (TPR) repeat protein
MDSLEYIDAYFKGEFPADEARPFEERIEEDPRFAEEVAHYLNTLAVAKEEQAEEKKKRFREIYDGLQHTQAADAPGTSAKIRQMGDLARGEGAGARRKRWIPALAAAVLIGVIALGWILFLSPPAAPKLADQYIRQNLDQLSGRMGAADPMQTGVILYDSGKFPEALKQFEAILLSDPSNPTAMLDAGITSLRIEHYDQALDFFKKLQGYTELHSNPALFYEALTLMKRNRAGDAASAKLFLHQIVQEGFDKKEDAAQLLGKMK